MKDTTDIAREAQQNGHVKRDTLAIDVTLAQALVDYLARRPYQEVFQLIHGLQALEKKEDD